MTTEEERFELQAARLTQSNLDRFRQLSGAAQSADELMVAEGVLFERSLLPGIRTVDESSEQPERSGPGFQPVDPALEAPRQEAFEFPELASEFETEVPTDMGARQQFFNLFESQFAPDPLDQRDRAREVARDRPDGVVPGLVAGPLDGQEFRAQRLETHSFLENLIDAPFAIISGVDTIASGVKDFSGVAYDTAVVLDEFIRETSEDVVSDIWNDAKALATEPQGSAASIQAMLTLGAILGAVTSIGKSGAKAVINRLRPGLLESMGQAYQRAFRIDDEIRLAAGNITGQVSLKIPVISSAAAGAALGFGETFGKKLFPGSDDVTDGLDGIRDELKEISDEVEKSRKIDEDRRDIDQEMLDNIDTLGDTGAAQIEDTQTEPDVVIPATIDLGGDQGTVTVTEEGTVILEKDDEVIIVTEEGVVTLAKGIQDLIGGVVAAGGVVGRGRPPCLRMNIRTAEDANAFMECLRRNSEQLEGKLDDSQTAE